MRIFRRKSIWRCFNTYAYIISAPLFFVGAVMFVGLIFTHFDSGVYDLGEQVTLSALAILLSIGAILFCCGFFNSLLYVKLDEECVTFINAVTKRETKYPFCDIAAVKITSSRISEMLKLTLKSGRSRYVAVDMVRREELKTIYKIINERVSTT